GHLDVEERRVHAMLARKGERRARQRELLHLVRPTGLPNKARGTAQRQRLVIHHDDVHSPPLPQPELRAPPSDATSALPPAAASTSLPSAPTVTESSPAAPPDSAPALPAASPAATPAHPDAALA